MQDNTDSMGSILDELSKAMTEETATDSIALTIENSESDRPDIEREFDKLMEQVLSSLPTDDIQFNEAIIKENLEEVLLMFISIHGNTNGKELLSDLSYLFDIQMSPGTVYPSLHDLEGEELLEMHSMVRTKEYSIVNEDAVCRIIEHTMVQHLAFGLLLYAFLPHLSPTS